MNTVTPALQTVPLETWGGLVTVADAHDLPEGASPRTYDTDFLVGSVATRPGLQSKYIFTGSEVGPSPGGSAVDTSLGNTPWLNPGNALLNTGVYATAAANPATSQSSSTSSGTSSGGGVAWTNPGNIDSNSAFATVALAAGGTQYNPSQSSGSASAYASIHYPTQSQTTTLSGLPSQAANAATLYVTLNGSASGGGFSTLNLNYSINGGATWINAGSWSASFSSQVVPISITGISNLSSVQIQIYAYAQISSGSQSSYIQVTSWYAVIPGSSGSNAQTLTAAISGLSIPSTATITGFLVSFNADYSGTAPSFQIGLSVGNLEPTFTLTTSPAIYTAGGAGNLWGYAGWTPATLGNLAVNFFASSNGTTTLNVNTLTVTVYYTYSTALTDALDIKQFGFSLPSTATPLGFLIDVNAYGSGATLTLQMLKAGVPVGNIVSVTLGASVVTIPFGSANNLFGTSWLYSDLNSTGFGVRLTASSASATTIYVGYVTLAAYFTPSQTNFTWIGSFLPQNGQLQNVAVDAGGNLWLENVTSAPGVLTLLRTNIAAGAHGFGITANNAELMAFSDLTQGIDIPLQYRNGWIDRISQVGPGAPPSCSGNVSVGSVATATAYSYSAGILTVTAANGFTAGEVVSIVAGVSDPLYALNGLAFNILGTGLSSSAYQIAETAVTGSGSTTAQAVPQYTYPIAASATGITQYASQPTSQTQLDDILWSSGPGSTSSGNVITIYYDENNQDTTLVNAVESGLFPVYVYVSETNQPVANGTFQVTSVGIGTPPGGSANRYYFTFTVNTTGYQNLGGGANAQPGRYQMTVAQVTTKVPVPNLEIGNQEVISGAGVSNWNATWTVVGTPSSGTYAILNTQMSSGGVATYQWSLDSGVAPVAGDLITITGTFNGNGIFNVTDALIASVTGTSAGNFTITGFPGAAISSSAESGLAESAGTQFQIDPGPALAGTATNPIYGNSGGGYLSVVGGTVQVIGTGTRQGVVFFITRNGYWTCPSPPFTFTTSVNANYILVNNIPIGPPNTVARGIAFTEAGQLGVAGANFFTLPQQVEFTIFNTTYTSSSLIIYDNVTTAAQFTFTDSVLLDGLAIDQEGFNLFNLIELGNPAWMEEYDSRIRYGLCQNKIQNFLNLSFDGGYLPNPGGNLAPLGWSVDAASNPSGVVATVQVSPTFGNSYYINNNTGSTQAKLGMIYQSAYQDAYQEPILNAAGLQTLYSVRVTARCPSGNTTGNLVIDLVNLAAGGYGASFGSFTLPFAGMTTNMQTYTGTLVTSAMITVPSGLVLRYYASSIGNGADLEVDRIEVFPTLIPVENTVIYESYVQQPESIDGETGRVVSINQNNQALMGAMKLFNSNYLLKESSLYSEQSVAGQEPANWGEPSASGQVGACGIYAYDGSSDNPTGEQWMVMACRKGLYLYEGGQPGKLMHEIYQIWDAINWNAGNSIWVRNDTQERKLYVGVPLPTPNFWLPNAPVNSTPASPNVILMCNYQGIDSGAELEKMPGIHVTMFGKLATLDMRRKWSIWQIASPYAGFIGDTRIDSSLNICNGVANSKVYTLNPVLTGYDDNVAFTSLYTTYGFVAAAKAAELPLLGYFRKLWKMLWLTIEGSGTMAPTFYANVLLGPTDPTTGFISWQMPVPWLLSSPPVQDSGTALNFGCWRMFIEFAVTGGWFRASSARLSGTKHPWNELNQFGPFA